MTRRSSRRGSAEPVVEKSFQKKRSKTVQGSCRILCHYLLDTLGSLKRSVSEFLCCCFIDDDESSVNVISHLAYMMDRAFSEKRSQAVMMLGLGFVQVGLAGLTYSFVWNYDDWEDDPRQEDGVAPFIEGVWHSWTFMADPGTHAPAFRPETRFLSAIITLGGIFFFACVLGITVELFLQKMDKLRQGQSNISESNHVLCLGWTQQTVHMIEELCLANKSNGGCVISILAQNSKEFMEEELAMQLPHSRRHGSRIVIRTGSPLLVNDLLRVGAHRAKAVVILAPVSAGPNEADANTVRVVLSLKTWAGDIQHGYFLAEVRDIDNEPLLRTVCDESVEIIVSHDMIGRLMVMSVRQPGLAKVYEALLGFEGDEFYMEEWPAVVGQRFGDLQLLFPDAVPIGLMTKGGELVLNPISDRIVVEGDKIVVIAEDKHSYEAEPRQDVGFSLPPTRLAKEDVNEKILICGWRRDVREVLKLIDKVAAPGTEVHMITHCVPVAKREKELLEDGFHVRELVHTRLVHHFGNTSVRRQLDKLPIESFTSCMIFAESAFEEDTMYADSHSLATLLLLRDIQVSRLIESDLQDDNMKHAGSAVDRLYQGLHQFGAMARCPVVCEILSPQTQATISASQQLSCLSDFCQTNKLIAQVMAMVTEERAVRELLDQLLGSSGSSICVVPSSRYAHYEEKVSFYALSQRASSFNEVLVGYQQRSSLERTVLNPPNKHACLPWELFDFAILQNRDSAEDLPSSRVVTEHGASELTGSAMRQSTVHLTRGATSDEDLQGEIYVPPAEDTEDVMNQQAHEESATHPDMHMVPARSTVTESDVQNLSSFINFVSEGAPYESEGSENVSIPDEDVDEKFDPGTRSPRSSKRLRQSLQDLVGLQPIPEMVRAMDSDLSTTSGSWKAAMSQMPAGERKKIRNSLSVMQEALSLADGDVAYAPSHIAQESLARMVSPSLGVSTNNLSMDKQGFASAQVMAGSRQTSPFTGKSSRRSISVG